MVSAELTRFCLGRRRRLPSLAVDAVGVDPEFWRLQVTEVVDERGVTTALKCLNW